MVLQKYAKGTVIAADADDETVDQSDWTEIDKTALKQENEPRPPDDDA